MVPDRACRDRLALAACTDDGGDGGDGTTTGTTTTGPNEGDDGNMTPPATIYTNGTASGTLDCQFAAQVRDPAMGDSQSVPMDAWNRRYEPTFSGGQQAPAGADVCLYWDGEAGDDSGTVPGGATTVHVYADGLQGASYFIEII